MTFNWRTIFEQSPLSPEEVIRGFAGNGIGQNFNTIAEVNAYTSTRDHPELIFVAETKEIYFFLGHTTDVIDNEDFIQDGDNNTYQRITTFGAGEDFTIVESGDNNLTLLQHHAYVVTGTQAKTFSLPHPADVVGDEIIIAKNNSQAASLTLSVRASTEGNQAAGQIQDQATYALTPFQANRTLRLMAINNNWRVISDTRTSGTGGAGTRGPAGAKGDQGDQGVREVSAYRSVTRGTAAPATPVPTAINFQTGVLTGAANWSLFPPAAFDPSTHVLYRSVGSFNPDGNVIGTFSAPSIFSGADGAKGDQGEAWASRYSRGEQGDSLVQKEC